MSGRTPDHSVRYPVNFQDWECLTFLHWPYEVEAVQRLVPDELTVQEWDGLTWVGVIPFRMARVRPPGLPPPPGWRAFPELNVRAYVRARDGRDGIWFLGMVVPGLTFIAALAPSPRRRLVQRGRRGRTSARGGGADAAGREHHRPLVGVPPAGRNAVAHTRRARDLALVRSHGHREPHSPVALGGPSHTERRGAPARSPRRAHPAREPASRLSISTRSDDGATRDLGHADIGSERSCQVH